MERATPEIIAALDENIAHTEEVLDDPTAVAELDAEFHSLIGDASGNRVLQLAREPSELLVMPTTELILRKVKEGAPRLLRRAPHVRRRPAAARQGRRAACGRGATSTTGARASSAPGATSTSRSTGSTCRTASSF